MDKNKIGSVKRVLFILILVAAFIVLSGVALMWYDNIERTTDRSETIADMGESRIVTAFFNDHSAAVGFAGDKLAKVDPEGNEIWSFETGSSVKAVEVSNDTGHIYIAIEGPDVLCLDRDGNLVAEATVRGRGMHLYYNEEAGRVVVAHGVGVTSQKFFVSVFDEDLNQISSVQTFMDTYAVAITSDAKLTFYGTKDSRVGAIDNSSDAVLWEALTKFAVKAIEIVEDSALVVAADERGNIFAISYDSPNGKIIWEYNLTDVTPVSMAVDTENEVIIIGDSNGFLHAFDYYGNYLMNKLIGSGEISAITFDHETESIYGSYGSMLFVATMIQNVAITTFDFGALGLAILVTGVIMLMITFFMYIYRASSRAHETMRLMSKGRIAYIMLTPTFLLLFVFVYYPIASGFTGAFTNWSPFRETAYVGFDNFVRIATDVYVWIGVKNMLLLTVTNLLKTVTMPLLAAVLMAHLLSNKLKYLYRTSFVLTTIVPAVAAMLMWRMMLDPNIGLINNVLRAIGLEQYAMAWLGEPDLAIWAIIFIGFPWIGIFPFLVYYGGLIGISQEIYDSSKIDGVNAFQRFMRIELPLITPQLKMLLLLGLIGSLQDYQGILLTTRGGPGRATYVPALEVFFNIADFGEYGYASAIGLMLFVFIMIVTLCILRIPTHEQV